MSDRTFIVLGDSGQLVHELREAVPAARIIHTRCLDLIPPLTEVENVLVLVGHGTVRRCCIEKLDQWIAESPPVRGVIRAFKPRKALRRGLRSASEAWKERADLLSPHGVSALVSAFIETAKRHDHEWFTVHEAADLLGLSVRQMRRIIEGETSHAPHVLLHLARIASVAREIADTGTPLATIAEEHHFADLPSMSRQFKRFVGPPPGRYRRKVTNMNGRNRQVKMAERVNCFPAPPTV